MDAPDPRDEARAKAGGKTSEMALWSHVVPFVAWIFLMHMLGDPAGWKYAVRSAVCLGLFLALRPWRWYARPSPGSLRIAVPAGLLVFLFWVAPESILASRWPALQEFYLKWAVMPFGGLPEAQTSQPYSPAVCGWPLTVVRLLGSALVIATIEEFFWRGFLYRWMLGRDFTKIDLGTFHAGMFFAVSIVFGLEHDRWLVGALAGVVYAWVMVRTRDIRAACIAHIVTNFVLGVYVIMTGSWAFW